ncbi:MAG: hypothetical protein GXO47_03165 [Chlorobi bacterium]|nr:hypothetical protein [Chlorobiota bacterium]
MKKNKKIKFDFFVIFAFMAFALYSYISGYAPGMEIIKDNFWGFFKEMMFILPVMFILVGLFDVWVPKEKVQKYIGKASGIKGIVLVMILGFLQAGPIYAAYPVAYMLWKKGTPPTNIFIYLSSVSIIQVPVIAFEVGFLGFKFFLLRVLISFPVFIILGFILGNYFEKKQFKFMKV